MGLVSAAYGEDDVSRIEDPEDKGSLDEDSGESSRNSVSLKVLGVLLFVLDVGGKPY